MLHFSFQPISLAVCLILVVAVTMSHGKANCPTPSPVCDADDFTAGKCILVGDICCAYVMIYFYTIFIRGDIKIPTYKPHTNHKRSSVRSHTLAPTTICDLSHSVCWSPLTDLGHISSVTYVCHPLWFVCGHRKGILMSPLTPLYSCRDIPTTPRGPSRTGNVL